MTPEREARRHRFVLRMAREEKFRARPLSVQPPAEPVVLRAVYGPLMGLDQSMILAVQHQEAYLKVRPDPRVSANIDRFLVGRREGRWGPREFLQNLLEMTASFGAQVTIVLIHSGLVLEVDAEGFEAWIHQGDTDIVGALLSPPLQLVDQRAEPLRGT